MFLAGSMAIYQTTAWMGHGGQIYLLFGKRQRAEELSGCRELLDRGQAQRQAEETLAFHPPLCEAEIIAVVGIRSRFFRSFLKISQATTPVAVVREMMSR